MLLSFPQYFIGNTVSSLSVTTSMHELHQVFVQRTRGLGKMSAGLSRSNPQQVMRNTQPPKDSGKPTIHITFQEHECDEIFCLVVRAKWPYDFEVSDCFYFFEMVWCILLLNIVYTSCMNSNAYTRLRSLVSECQRFDSTRFAFNQHQEA